MSQPPYQDQHVVISRLDISFGNLVAFFVKAALAFVPAAVIVWFMVMIFWAVLMFLFTGQWGWMMHRWTL